MSKAALDRIRIDVTMVPVVLYMRGSPAFPQCGPSAVIVQLLDHLGARYKAVDVNADAGIKIAIREFGDWPTVPQLYVKGQFVGDADIVQQMFEAGELQELLTAARAIG